MENNTSKTVEEHLQENKVPRIEESIRVIEEKYNELSRIESRLRDIMGSVKCTMYDLKEGHKLAEDNSRDNKTYRDILTYRSNEISSMSYELQFIVESVISSSVQIETKEKFIQERWERLAGWVDASTQPTANVVEGVLVPNSLGHREIIRVEKKHGYWSVARRPLIEYRSWDNLVKSEGIQKYRYISTAQEIVSPTEVKNTSTPNPDNEGLLDKGWLPTSTQPTTNVVEARGVRRVQHNSASKWFRKEGDTWTSNTEHPNQNKIKYSSWEELVNAEGIKQYRCLTEVKNNSTPVKEPHSIVKPLSADIQTTNIPEGWISATIPPSQDSMLHVLLDFGGGIK